MKEQLTRIVEAHRQARLPALTAALAEAGTQIERMVALEDHHRSAYQGPESLGKTLGGFGSEALDLRALSSVLQQSHASRGLEKQRYQQLKRLAKDLGAARQRYERDPPPLLLHDLDTGPTALLEAFETHMAPLSEALRLLRMARLEARGRYDPAQHDAVLAQFNWRQLENAELALCPPFVVLAKLGPHLGPELGGLLELLTSGRPVKILLLHSAWHPEQEETGRAAALQGMADVSLLFLALRAVHFAQTSVAGPTPLADRVVQALESPRPAVVSIYAHGAEQPGFAERAARALASRAFPHFVYDPERADDFVSCLDLGDNPQPDEAWVEEPLAYVEEGEQRGELGRPLTFADYAAGEAEFQAQFSPLGAEDSARALPLADWLALPATERWNRVPFVHALDPDKHLTRRVPSMAMLAHTQDRMHLWSTLQELGGIHNPYVQAAERRLRDELEAEKQAALAALRADLEGQHQSREQESITQAMRTLAARLTGAAPLEGATLPLAGGTATQAQGEVTAPAPAASNGSAAPAPAAAAPAAPQGDGGPWIDPRLCTSCDECIDINKNIFVYNGTKKAVIKDPRGGPYKDIVRAAEKCSSGAIHPGMPLDPAEKDTGKWIKRAEVYQ